jgi:hypothetical protein
MVQDTLQAAPPGAPLLRLFEADSAISRAMQRYTAASTRLVELEARPPADARWGALTQHHSEVARLRRELANAQMELRAARMGAFVSRMKSVRSPADGVARATSREPRQLPLTVPL